MLRRVLIAACALLAAGAGSRLRAEDAFIVFPETRSPDGRFAIAWGLPKHPEIWNKGRHIKEDQAESFIADVEEFEGDVENYVVDLRLPQALAKLQSRYWQAADLRPNRHHLDVVWSAASDLVLVNHTFRWDCRAFEAIRISEGKTDARLDLKKALDAKLRQHFRKALPHGEHFGVRELAISFSEPALVSGEVFQAKVEAEYPSKGEDAWSGEGEIRFALTPAKGSGLRLKVLNLR